MARAKERKRAVLAREAMERAERQQRRQHRLAAQQQQQQHANLLPAPPGPGVAAGAIASRRVRERGLPGLGPGSDPQPSGDGGSGLCSNGCCSVS
ncbi:hypothetical protein GPECTOR_62g898 [Gonium pectorale]|uniref:Uncharacterized protein n=1 Tax=Gonium pectorale TaxID=33097 RepID=A0A150G4T0_GONPE|nr:hypothetical protein GPECTOR_62g898 [Gonium pectorale]|eukprot:KXZ44783.1 hypothetical protein GPECTOR_62g898 [Gonium pectorale]